MKRAQDKYGKQGFVVVGFNADKTVPKMKDYIDSKGYGWSHNFMGDQRRANEKRFWVSGYPTNFLIGRDGKIITRSIRLGHGSGEKQVEAALAAPAGTDK